MSVGAGAPSPPEGAVAVGVGEGAHVFSVWDRNIQLALYSIGIYLPIAWFETGKPLRFRV